MTPQDKKKLLELVKAREEVAVELKSLYNSDSDASTQRLEIRLDKITDRIRKIVFPPIKGKFMVYDNS